MSASPIAIRRLDQANADDVMRYRDIRLEALKSNADAYGSTFESESVQPLGWFAERLGSSTVLGAFCDAQVVAIAGFATQQTPNRSH